MDISDCFWLFYASKYIIRNWIKNSFLLNTMTEKYDHFFYEEIKGEYIDFHEQWWGTVRLQRTMMWLP